MANKNTVYLFAKLIFIGNQFYLLAIKKIYLKNKNLLAIKYTYWQLNLFY